MKLKEEISKVYRDMIIAKQEGRMYKMTRCQERLAKLEEQLSNTSK
jgi:hypothetical protein